MAKRANPPYLKCPYYLRVSWVGRDTCNPVWICPDHWEILNTNHLPIVNEYCEGKMKRTRRREWNRNMKPLAYKESKLYTLRKKMDEWWRAFWSMSRRVIVACKVKLTKAEPKRKRVLIVRWVCGNRPETEWAIHGQVEGGIKPSGGPNRLPLKR